MNKMKYLSHYEEYPLYEAAEGGYFYAGVALVESEQMSLQDCKREFANIWEVCKKDNAERGFTDDNEDEWDNIISRTKNLPWIYNEKENLISKSSYYVGEGEFYVIEDERGCEERGRQLYC